MKDETSPVSMKVDASRLPAKGVTVKFEADERQRAALASNHGLEKVRDFRFQAKVEPWKREGARVTGEVNADITQLCVVTLEPLQAKLVEEISAVFVPEDSRLARIDIEGGEMLLDAEGDDAPETFSNNRIDVGALAEELFELAIDPYPRAKGAKLPENAPQDEAETRAEAPFAKLGSLVRKS
ncbi:MAG: DUF177 domain-containing protein [Rhizobiaceae bacterium]|nr:DUF177 domain-containing protein [Rhizobiaceae bacterium]